MSIAVSPRLAAILASKRAQALAARSIRLCSSLSALNVSFLVIMAGLDCKLIRIGFKAELDCDLVRLAVVAFMLAIQHSIHFTFGVAVFTGPSGKCFALLPESALNLFG